ncbi:MAG: rhomboid family intramembrane serine protease [Rhodobacteraceae bacterium]|nr:rhomboid family intramembrane serine protease [Paracoccaceae bacterium]
MRDNRQHQEDLKFGPIPRAVLALAGVIAGLELMFSAGDTGLVGGVVGAYWRSTAIENFAFSEWLLREQLRGGIPAAEWHRFVTYGFLHSQFASSAMSTVFILAFGNFLTRFVSSWQVLAIFFAGIVAGAGGFALVLDAAYPLIGSSPGYFAIFGGILAVFLVGKASRRLNRLMLSIPLYFIGLQILYRVIFGGPDFWLADIAGCAAGFLGGIFSCLGFRPGLLYMYLRLTGRR